MKRFTVYRPNVPDTTHTEFTKNPPDEPQFEGIIFTDGTVVQHWCTVSKSTCHWYNLQDLLTVHGHPEYGTYFIWHDGLPDDLPEEWVFRDQDRQAVKPPE
jgi:hypothetical protein